MAGIYSTLFNGSSVKHPAQFGMTGLTTIVKL